MSVSWAGRSVLVTGATGIVGSHLSKELVKRGARVVAFVLDDDPLADFFASGTSAECAIVRGNLTDLAACVRAINIGECETVFHLGAQTIVGAALRDPLETFESNVRGTYHVLEAARRLSSVVKAVVVASSDKAYGDLSGAAYVEDMPLRGRHPYDVSKSCGDLIATTYAHTYALPVAIARCGNIFGGGDLNWSRIVPGSIRSIHAGEAPVLRSDGTLVRDYVYVADVVDAYILLAERLLGGEHAGEAFNFSCESRVSVLEMIRAIASAMNVRVEPEIRGDARFEIPEQTLSAKKARTLLGWSPAWSLDAGLAETVAWYRSHFERNARFADARR